MSGWRTHANREPARLVRTGMADSLKYCGHRFMKHLLTTALSATYVLASAAVIETTPIQLYAGETFVLNESGVKRIAVGNGDIVSASALDDKQVLFIPSKAGRTTVHLWMQNGHEKILSIKVDQDDLHPVLEEVKSLIGPNGHVDASIVGNHIVLKGTDLSVEASHRVAEVAKLYPQVVNLTSRQAGVEKMVYMEVHIVEVSKKALDNLGINWQTAINGPMLAVVGDIKGNNWFRSTSDGTANNISANFPPATMGTQNGAPLHVSPFASYFGLQTTMTSVLNFLVSSGDAYVLAEPRLSCRSGGTADFLAGGEVPIPVTNTTGQASVTFKPYGVKFNISPVVSESGAIAATISTELSAIDSTITVDNIPGFVTRRTSTDVSLSDGQTLVLSGLLNDTANNAVDRVAGLGSLPILGPLFRSKEFQKNQSDLVITVTPHFISPESEINRTAIAHGDAKLQEKREELEGKPASPASTKSEQAPHEINTPKFE